ncbi:ankyrin repeat-containing domain protein [Lasiosphaeris hirsuta]|uniref:Ankyrin repeat-containing domain protein n=1 Tax=Lasiosphaeris hirsuta TaxID=260670 RepID=A0AA40AA75_9PEZI|nr:ankyrin repeat-containing domain protein [Lasiosphaeris hirsuta]
MEIRDIVETSCGELRAASRNQHSFVQSMSAGINIRLNALEAQLSAMVPGQLRHPSTTPLATGPGSSVVHIQGSLCETCDSRHCKCQCHRTSTVASPSWAKPLIGSLILRYNGAVVFGPRHCDVRTCKTGGRRSMTISYVFPTWLLGRAVSVSAGWDSLTNMGAWLHLVVPRVTSPPGLWRAVMYGDLAWLRQKIVSKDFLPTDIEATGEGFLSHILRYRRYGVVAFLLEMGFSTTFVDLSGGSAKVVAQKQLYFDKDLGADVVKLLHRIAGDEEKNQSPTNKAPVSALEKISISVENALLASPAIINTVDELGLSALHWATEWGEIAKVATLIQNGAFVDLRATGRHQKTPLHFAAYEGFPQIILLLLENGADIHARDFRAYTPLHCGIKKMDSVKTLLTAGANPNAQSVMGATALHLTATTSYGTHIETIYGLSATGVDHNSRMQMAGIKSDAYEAFGLECPDPADMEPNDCSGEIMAELVRAGADCELADYDGMTPLMYAAAAGNVPAVRHLRKLGARLDTIAGDGMTVLDYAAIFWDCDFLNCLRELEFQGIDPDTPYAFGHTALRWFERRLLCPWLPGQQQPTQGGVFAFYALVSELRLRNWNSGQFFDTRDRLIMEGFSQRQLQTWLGWQWQRLHDDPELTNQTWDGGLDPWTNHGDTEGDWSVDFGISTIFDPQTNTANKDDMIFSYPSEVCQPDDIFFDAQEYY